MLALAAPVLAAQAANLPSDSTATRTTVAVLPSDGDTLSSNELEAITDEMRAAALKVLHKDAFVLHTQDVVIKRLGGAENYIKECRESSCIVDLGKKARVDYVAKASVLKLDGKIRLKVELYNVSTEDLIGIFNDEADNVRGLLAIVRKRSTAEIFGKIPGALVVKTSSPVFAEGISVQNAGGGYEFERGKRYLVYLSTDPIGAIMSFDGVPAASCPKTPCSTELSEGSVRIIAALEQYETADTTVFIKQNNQSINIRLKANFGVLEVKPAYLDGIDGDEQWSLTIGGHAAYSWENRLSPNIYKVELRHRCYEAIDFEAGINKDRLEIFDMASHIRLKKGGLDLSAEADDEPVSEPVFVNGRQVGETPFIGSVPVCSKIEIGAGREEVNVIIRHNESVRYTHKMDTEERRRRLAIEWQAREEAEQRELEKASLKGPWFALGVGAYLNAKNANPNGNNALVLISINPEFLSVANGHLSFGADVEWGFFVDANEKDTTMTNLFMGETSTKLSFGEYRSLYLTAGAGLFYAGKSYFGPSYSVGGGFGISHFSFIDAQYHFVSMNNRNANYWTIKVGASMPYSQWFKPAKPKNSQGFGLGKVSGKYRS